MLPPPDDEGLILDPCQRRELWPRQPTALKLSIRQLESLSPILDSRSIYIGTTAVWASAWRILACSAAQALGVRRWALRFVSVGRRLKISVR